MGRRHSAPLLLSRFSERLQTMRMPHYLGLVVGGLGLLLARNAPAQAALPVYTDHLVNGFQDWSWGTRDFGNPSPVHSGSSSVAASLAAWQALSFWRQDFNASLYANFTFWANGGTNGGQRLRVYAQYGANSGTTYQLPSPLPANAWQQVVVPFSALGVVNVSNLNRITLQLTAAGTTGTFYVDDVQLSAAAAPALTHLDINATQTVRSVDARWFGINTAMWDGYFDTPETIALLQQMGTRALRCMGGSLSDNYHWASDLTEGTDWPGPGRPPSPISCMSPPTSAHRCSPPSTMAPAAQTKRRHGSPTPMVLPPTPCPLAWTNSGPIGKAWATGPRCAPPRLWGRTTARTSCVSPGPRRSASRLGNRQRVPRHLGNRQQRRPARPLHLRHTRQGLPQFDESG